MTVEGRAGKHSPLHGDTGDGAAFLPPFDTLDENSRLPRRTDGDFRITRWRVAVNKVGPPR